MGKDSALLHNAGLVAQGVDSVLVLQLDAPDARALGQHTYFFKDQGEERKIRNGLKDTEMVCELCL